MPYIHLMRLNKPIGIFLLLWPTLWALWIAARGLPEITILIIFIFGVIIMRCAGCVINDIADRNYDGHIRRTCNRPLVNGTINRRNAMVLFILLISVAAILVCCLNVKTMLLSLIAVILATIYPFMKRYTHWPQLFLGLAFAWSIPMAFMAQQRLLPPVTWLVFIINVVWTLVYDTQYAMVDREDDIKIGIRSTAILFGSMDVLIIALLQLLILALLVILGLHLHLLVSYYLCLMIVAGLFAWQYYLIQQRRSSDCFDAFMNNNWVGFVIFIGLALNYF